MVRSLNHLLTILFRIHRSFAITYTFQLQRFIFEDFSQFILQADNALTVWMNLENQFSQVDIVNILEIQNELTHLLQGNLDILTYFTKLTSPGKKIDSFIPTRDCTCVIQCTYNAASDLQKYKDQYCDIKFVNGINDGFSNVCSQILLIEPLSSLDKTFSMVLGQEHHITSQNSSTDSIENQHLYMKI